VISDISEIKSELASARASKANSDFDDLLTTKENLLTISDGDQTGLDKDAALSASKFHVGSPFILLLNAEADSEAPSCATFNLPTSTDFSSVCVDSSPSAFFVDRKSNCERRIVKLEEACRRRDDVESPISPAFYHVGKSLLPGKVIKSAANGSDYDVLGCARPDASPPLDQPSAVKIEIEGNSCDPTYDDGTSTCNETVKEARYRITIDKNGWIKKAMVRFACGPMVANPNDGSSIVRIRHQISFLVEGDEESVIVRSGNPGYQDGKPVLAGVFNETAEQDGTASVEADSLKVPSSSSSSSGLCSPQSVAFNRNLGSVCRLDLSGVSDCDGLRSRVKELFVGPGETIPDRIGIFGNSPENDTSQWIEIINEGMPADFTSPSSSSSSSSSSCDNVVSGVGVKILYARDGSVTDPQAKIVGVWRQFKSRKVSLKKDNRFFFSSSVSFVDVSNNAQVVAKPPPVVSAKVPRDFFYPLFSNATQRPRLSTLLVWGPLFAATTFF